MSAQVDTLHLSFQPKKNYALTKLFSQQMLKLQCKNSSQNVSGFHLCIIIKSKSKRTKICIQKQKTGERKKPTHIHKEKNI